jgi:hypothetical protein
VDHFEQRLEAMDGKEMVVCYPNHSLITGRTTRSKKPRSAWAGRIGLGSGERISPSGRE